MSCTEMNLKGCDLAGRAVPGPTRSSLRDLPYLLRELQSLAEGIAFLSSFLNTRSRACSPALLQLLPVSCQFQQVTGRSLIVTPAEHTQGSSTKGGLTGVYPLQTELLGLEWTARLLFSCSDGKDKVTAAQ